MAHLEPSGLNATTTGTQNDSRQDGENSNGFREPSHQPEAKGWEEQLREDQGITGAYYFHKSEESLAVAVSFYYNKAKVLLRAKIP